MIGAMILGMGEIFGAAYISSQYRDGIAYAIMILFIIFRPLGSMGKGEVERV